MFVIVEFSLDEETATLVGDGRRATRVFRSQDEAHEFASDELDGPYEIVELLEVLGTH